MQPLERRSQFESQIIVASELKEQLTDLIVEDPIQKGSGNLGSFWASFARLSFHNEVTGMPFVIYYGLCHDRPDVSGSIEDRRTAS